MAKRGKAITTMQLSTETRDELAKLGKMGDTFEDVIKRLIEHAKKIKFQ